ncbi:MAG: hypothetical protein OEW08_14765, partial [Gammaproteobacteria bacterium]|nr:hypothetical protein [Gammaproteobacteria bacterium]
RFLTKISNPFGSVHHNALFSASQRSGSGAAARQRRRRLEPVVSCRCKRATCCNKHDLSLDSGKTTRHILFL